MSEQLWDMSAVALTEMSMEWLQTRLDELYKRKGVTPPLFIIPEREALIGEIRRLEQLTDARVSEQIGGKIHIPAVEHTALSKQPLFVIPPAKLISE